MTLADRQPMMLPCESELWEAPDAVAWLRLLESPSPYGNARQRLDGLSLQHVMGIFRDGAALPAPAQYPGRLALRFSIGYAACRLNSRDRHNSYGRKIAEAETTLARWFATWTMVVSHHPAAGFLHDSLPYFLITKALLYCSRNGYDIWDAESGQRLALIHLWHRHIRTFLDTHQEVTSELWETLPMNGMLREGQPSGSRRASRPPQYIAAMDDPDKGSLVPAFMAFKFED
jgi:hypothetical protein